MRTWLATVKYCMKSSNYSEDESSSLCNRYVITCNYFRLNNTLKYKVSSGSIVFVSFRKILWIQFFSNIFRLISNSWTILKKKSVGPGSLDDQRKLRNYPVDVARLVSCKVIVELSQLNEKSHKYFNRFEWNLVHRCSTNFNICDLNFGKIDFCVPSIFTRNQ